MSEIEQTEAPAKAGITLEGDTKRHFDIIKKKMEKALPGINPNNADILRHALFIASKELNSRSTPE